MNDLIAFLTTPASDLVLTLFSVGIAFIVGIVVGIKWAEWSAGWAMRELGRRK